jgi:hypothetical protein
MFHRDHAEKAGRQIRHPRRGWTDSHGPPTGMHRSTTGRPGTETTRSTALATRHTPAPGTWCTASTRSSTSSTAADKPVCDRQRRGWPGMGLHATRSLPTYAYLHQHSPHHTIVDSFFHAALRCSRRHAQAGPAVAYGCSWPPSALPQPRPEPADLRALTSAANPSLRRSESAIRADGRNRRSDLA